MYTLEDAKSKIALPNRIGWTHLTLRYFRDGMLSRIAHAKETKAKYNPEDFPVLVRAFDEEIRVYEECLACTEAGIGRLTEGAAQTTNPVTAA